MIKKWFGRKKKQSPEEQAQEIQRLVAAGKKIEAIALYRELSGVGLAQAKEDIEAAMAEVQSSAAKTTTASPESMIVELENRRKINAIKLFRELTNVGLKEAKDAIDEIEAVLPYGREEALSRLRDKLADYPPVTPSRQAAAPTDADMQMVLDELHNGRKITAIKIYRELTGLGLKEAKDYVDQLEGQIKQFGQVTHATLRDKATVDPAGVPEIVQLLQRKRKIEAIKIYREMTGLGLKESKDAIDALERQLKK